MVWKIIFLFKGLFFQVPSEFSGEYIIILHPLSLVSGISTEFGWSDSQSPSALRASRNTAGQPNVSWHLHGVQCYAFEAPRFDIVHIVTSIPWWLGKYLFRLPKTEVLWQCRQIRWVTAFVESGSWIRELFFLRLLYDTIYVYIYIYIRYIYIVSISYIYI